MVKLNEAQKYKKQLLNACIKKKLTTREAAVQMGRTMRCIQKMIIRYKERGDISLIHGNTGKSHQTEEDLLLNNKILDIFYNTRVNDRNPFDDISYTYFQEILFEDYQIKKSVTYVKKILKESGYKSPIKHKCKNNKEVHLLRERKEHTGELVQADGTPYDWFKDGHNYCIQGFVDDATGYPTGLYMTKNECTLGYTEAFRNMAVSEGIPLALYPDKAGVFFVNNQKKDDGERHLTQFGIMMENMGVDMFPAHSPQAKGRIERFWNTIQHRLPNLFVLRGITTVEQANNFLRAEFPKIYKRWFPVEPKSDETYFVKANLSEINSILKATFPGKVDRGGLFTFKGYKFLCPELAEQKILINLNEKEGLWITSINSEKRYIPKLVETDTTGLMPEVTQQLIERIFLKNAKPKFREVYLDIDDVVLSQIQRKKTA